MVTELSRMLCMSYVVYINVYFINFQTSLIKSKVIEPNMCLNIEMTHETLGNCYGVGYFSDAVYGNNKSIFT